MAKLVWGRKAEGLEAVAPYCGLCVMGLFHADKFAVSQFLLFFSFMLGGALTLMMTLGQTVIDRGTGMVPASELLWKASLVLPEAGHAVAAELLGEKVLLFNLPEITPELLWFSLHLDGDSGAIITADKATRSSRRGVCALLVHQGCSVLWRFRASSLLPCFHAVPQ
ncbi:unnamed protein product [Urochloa humidicola]